jgi:saccharopine dehydrogenase-like NADP-dependent oxidoreductase
LEGVIMHRVLVLGAGKIGALIAGLLAESQQYEVQLGDASAQAAEAVARAHGLPGIHPCRLDALDSAALTAFARTHAVDAVISSLPYYCNPAVATAARAVPVHYFDLTEDINVTRTVAAQAAGATTAFVPQCGLAPGFISIAGGELIRHFDRVRGVRLRVGALPQHPHNVLKYSLTWSTEGLINEYGNPCEAVIDGRLLEVRPLEGLEEIEIDGTLYEAFNTSGGLGSLAQTFGARVENMDYKTMRYPGHCAQMRLLMNELKLNQDRDTLRRILENAVPQTLQDVVIVYAAVAGVQSGELREESYVSKIYPQLIAGRLWSAIQVSTAASLCAVLDRVLAQPDRYHGPVAQESFRLPDILGNRFGQRLAAGGSKELSGDVIMGGAAGRQRLFEPQTADGNRGRFT